MTSYIDANEQEVADIVRDLFLEGYDFNFKPQGSVAYLLAFGKTALHLAQTLNGVALDTSGLPEDFGSDEKYNAYVSIVFEFDGAAGTLRRDLGEGIDAQTEAV